MIATTLVLTAAMSWMAHSPPHQRLPASHTAAARTLTPRAQAQPYRSDAKFDYFRLSRDLDVSLTKPLGAVLEEALPAGVKVEELQEGGSAEETGLLKKGDRLNSVNAQDVSTATFDEVINLLIAAPEEVSLSVTRTVISRRPRAQAAAITLTVDRKTIEVDKGVIMRTAIQHNKMEIHKGMKAKMSSCGGVGQCSSCWVQVLEGGDNLSDPTETELKRGQKKPAGYRMACQSSVNGPVSVEVKSLD